MHTTRRMLSAMALVPMLAIACTEGDSPSAPEVALTSAADHSFQITQHFIVCKEGTDATYSVEVNAIAQPDVFVADGTCEIVERWTSGDPKKFITVTEQIPAGYYIQGWTRQAFVGADQPGVIITGTSADVTAGIFNDVGWLVTYTNAPCTGEIGNFVWDDTNGNGLQDSGEVGVPGVVINLYDSAGNLIGTMVTDTNGFYLFSGLCAGDYTVEVDEATVPAGWIQTPTLVGADPTIDNNVNPTVVTLATPTTSDLTVDFGYFQPGPLEGCTPGYYKNLKKHLFAWTDAGYDPDQSVASVFAEAANAPYSALGAATLHEGLSFQGGSSVEEKAEILLRAAIAAILNAGSPDVTYELTVPQIVAAVNAALVSQDVDAILTLATALDQANNAGCPLSNGK